MTHIGKRLPRARCALAMTQNIKTEARGWASLRFGILSYCLGAAGEVFEEFCHVDAVCKGVMHRQIDGQQDPIAL